MSRIWIQTGQRSTTTAIGRGIKLGLPNYDTSIFCKIVSVNIFYAKHLVTEHKYDQVSSPAMDMTCISVDVDVNINLRPRNGPRRSTAKSPPTTQRQFSATFLPNMLPDTPERSQPLPGLHYASLRAELGFAEDREGASSTVPPDNDWGVQDGFTYSLPTRTLKDKEGFESGLRGAKAADAPPVEELREALVKRCQNKQREYVRERRADPKRREIEDGLRKIAAQQIAAAERMLAELYDGA